MTAIKQISLCERLRRVFRYILDEGPFVSAALERRIEKVLEETVSVDPGEQTFFMARLLNLAPRIKEEACEVFATNIVHEVALALEWNTTPIMFNTEFPCYLYAAVTSCIQDLEPFTWHIEKGDRFWKFTGLNVHTIDWRDVLAEGAISDTVIKALESIGFGTSLVDRNDNPLEKSLTRSELNLRPLGEDIEPLILAALAELPSPAPGNEHSNYCRAMLLAGIDPAFIFAFQATNILVTQERSSRLNDTILRAWDEAVVEYRAQLLTGSKKKESSPTR